MSYEDTHCPCGGPKPADTMLCEGCMEDMRQHPAMANFLDNQHNPAIRRQAAIVLLSLVRGRSAQLTSPSFSGH